MEMDFRQPNVVSFVDEDFFCGKPLKIHPIPEKTKLTVPFFAILNPIFNNE